MTFFYFIDENNLTNFADDNTPYAISNDLLNITSKLEGDAKKLIKWFELNYFKMNADKCKLLITNHETDVCIPVDGHDIAAQKTVKLLGITIDNKLEFKEHLSNICKKVSLKIHALARISQFMSTDKLRKLMKAFIESQFGYCPLIWMFHSRTLNNHINRLHKRALRLVYKDTNSTFHDLLAKDKSFSIHHRNLQKLATEMFKIKNELSPRFMSTIFPTSKNPYNMRSDQTFQTRNIKTVYKGTETLSFRGPKVWSMLPDNIKNSKTLKEFKIKIKTWQPVGCTCRICKDYIPQLGFL